MAIAAILAAVPMHARAADAAAGGELEEIQVTATRHSESISDVPYNISAVSGADIAAAGITDLQGLTHMIPGLVSPDLGARGSSINSNLTIRGLNASSINAETQQIAAAGVVPDLVGIAGNRLPGVSRQQGTVAVDYGVPFGATREFHAHLDAAYRSDFWTSLPSSPTAADLPGFVLLNARAGWGFAHSWRIDAFMNNMTNQEAATSVSTEPGLEHNRADFVSRPRTVGLELNYSFKDH
jgi:outer membrane receptor protein involved in Fe transport